MIIIKMVSLKNKLIEWLRIRIILIWRIRIEIKCVINKNTLEYI